MRLVLDFADGCTGGDDERVTVRMPRFMWSGLRVWILHGGPKLATGRGELQELLVKRAGQPTEDDLWGIEMSRGAAQWVMVYFEMVGEVRFVLRPDLDDRTPMYRFTVEANRVA